MYRQARKHTHTHTLSELSLYSTTDFHSLVNVAVSLEETGVASDDSQRVLYDENTELYIPLIKISHVDKHFNTKIDAHLYS